MTEHVSKRSRRAHPALATRILAVGASAAATLGLVGAMAARPAGSVAPGIETTIQPAEQRPIHIVVVVRRLNAPARTAASSAMPKPRVVYRYVRRQATTSTHGS